MEDIRDNFDKWVDQWDKAQKSEAFKSKPQPPTQTSYGSDFFGLNKPSSESTLKDADHDYWTKVYKLSRNAADTPDIFADEETHDSSLTGDEMANLNEDAPVKPKDLAPTSKFDGKSVATITDDMGKLANPVSFTTRGPDTSDEVTKVTRVTPDWTGGSELMTLHKMKEELNNLTAKLAADPMTQDSGVQKIISQIDSLMTKIDELSSELNPEFRKEYLS